MLYWDYAAAAPPYDEVVRTMEQIMQRIYANPSSLHQAGAEAAEVIRRAREVCAAAMGASSPEVFFTSGATESNNLAIKGAALQYKDRGRHLITTEIEHPSVYETCKQLQSLGWEVTFLRPGEDGKIDPAAVEAAVRKDTVLVSVMHVNNETGAVQPVGEIGVRIKKANRLTLFHVDGVQGFGKLPVRLGNWQADLYSLSPHKLRGPRGAGILYKREGVRLFPLLSGGSHENGMRAGTENVPAIAASAKAIRLAEERRETFVRGVTPLRDRLIRFLEGVPELTVNSRHDGAPHIVHFSYPGMSGEVFARKLEQLGMLVSTRSACSSRHAEPSRVLLAMDRSVPEALGGIRISFGDTHTEADVDKLIEAIAEAVHSLKSIQGGLNRS